MRGRPAETIESINKFAIGRRAARYEEGRGIHGLSSQL